MAINFLFQILARSREIVGMNARNLEFIRPANSKRGRMVADNKLLAKQILVERGLPVPKTYAIITSARDLRQFDQAQLPKSFVLKPNRGFGGGGIVLTYNKRLSGAWLDGNLHEMTWADVKNHVQDILDGRFSLANRPDIAFFEERLVKESIFKPFAYRGVPDIRIIVYNSIPVMAMMRMPTRESQGKANLHLGGIGVGIDIATGVTNFAICRDNILNDAGGLTGLRIPQWDKILALSVQAQQSSGLGYLGVDIVLDKHNGPVILELNARPGLSIQIANMAPLGERLRRVKGLEFDNVERSIRLAKDLFSREADGARVEVNSSLIKVVETVVFNHKDDLNVKIPVKAKIDSGASSSSIDYEIGRQLGYSDVVDYIRQFKLDSPMSEERARTFRRRIRKELKSHVDVSNVKLIHSASGSTVRVTVPAVFKLKGKIIKSDVNLISRDRLTYPMIVGRKDLEGFLIKPRN
ncbi:MAG: hypothetical protein A2445_03265 [Candidatus Jacksonbacteria bacterium RIFOXYC2_FULL_44_29]|nr:MAG: Alpha-L-glutamate ligase-like protein [Parcubacteria group bacterium GW2011_GWC2_44_22]OGY75378.1 MAG: hypothetical protein A2240_03410 [Candidatus Jacksonbacteria bacterium RIFOXYA2_FULL_43_12]OGY77086.1 MAG: hypothetical protein A2295_05095 [Candidatus Jacksonbacteria bacterium RIFOXYB2_FULL_44_15]OGY78353.1 MAG: hypothetical protein A2550_00350 [Candidatus Jacksonbacteria bacterium RIFOXYD2_FULL_43_21]OGY79818.1 MAG: hypothetical protein A2445_03265 [Candidatus Jacksonbacteria bacter